MEPQHFKYINVARGIAIIMVICVHTSQHVVGFSGYMKSLASFGQMGVQLFFIASALTLCLSWKAREGSNNYLIFIVRRFFRIAPMYFIGMIFYFIISNLDSYLLDGGFARNFKYSAQNIASNILMIHGFVKSANNTVVPGGWSIGAEFAFYLTFPLFAMIMMRGRIIAAIITSAAISAGWVVYCLSSGKLYSINSFEYYSPISQLMVFLSGIILYLTVVNDYIKKSKPLLISFILLALIGFIVFIKYRSGMMVWLNLLIVSLAFCCLILILKNKVIDSNAASNIGIVSFSMYINHFLIVWFVLPVATKYSSEYLNGNVNFIIALLSTIALSYGMARLTYEHIELRFMRAGRSLINKISTSSST